MIDDMGARALIAAVLKKAHDDYTEGKSCPEWCQYKEECKTNKVDKNQCDARDFLHSAWCAALTEGLDLDHKDYIAVCIKNHRLSKNTYRYIEGQIRDYKKIKKEMENLKDDIINGSPISQEVRGSDIGDSTASKAIKISLDKKIAAMERTVRAIEKTYSNLGSDKKSVMTDIWERRYTSLGLADMIGVDERTVRRWQQTIIYSVAIELKFL